jgi:uncharacterized protein
MNTNSGPEKQVLKPKHVPERTCIACRSGKNKRDLIRIVRTENGIIEVDPTGKKSGRGAYLCPDPGCWEKGLKGNNIEHALHTRLTRANRQSLILFSKSIAKS